MAPDERQGPEGSVRLRDARAIRALAHPARLAVLDALTGRATITATEAADIAGLSPSAMSYHLRALAKWGIVREAEGESADGRERRWERTGRGLTLDAPAHGADAATAFIATHYFDQTRKQLVRWLENQHAEPVFWRESAIMAYRETWLTEDQAVDLRRMADDLLGRNAASRDKPPAGARRVRVAFLMFPVDLPPTRGE